MHSETKNPRQPMHFPVNPTFLIFKANDANGIPNLVTRMSI